MGQRVIALSAEAQVRVPPPAFGVPEAPGPSSPTARDIASMLQAAVDKPSAASEKEAMTKEQIRDSIAQKPFKPFKVRLPDGLEIEVPTGDHIHLHPSGRTLFIHLPDGGTKIIDVALVSALETKETA